MARGSIIKRCPICRKQGLNPPYNCNHREAIYHITYRFGNKQKWKSIGPNKKQAENIMPNAHQGVGNRLDEQIFGDKKRYLEGGCGLRGSGERSLSVIVK